MLWMEMQLCKCQAILPGPLTILLEGHFAICKLQAAWKTCIVHVCMAVSGRCMGHLMLCEHAEVHAIQSICMHLHHNDVQRGM